MSTDPQIDRERDLALLCGVLNASYSRLVAIMRKMLDDESWAIGGIRSPEHWLTMRAGLSPFRARQVVSIARRRSELPTVMGEFADGQLSFDQVAVIALYSPAHVEASVAELAIHASVPQLRRALSRYSFDPPAHNGYTPTTTTFPTPPTNRESTSTAARDAAAGDMATGNGTPPVKRHPTPAGPTPVRTARARPTAVQPARTGGAATHPVPAGPAAVPLMGVNPAQQTPNLTTRPAGTASRSETTGRAVQSVNRRDTYRTYIHLDTEGAWLTGQPRLPAHLAAKLTCEGIIQLVWHTQGAPVNVGRAQRIVPTRTRRLIHDRDRGCRYPGCPATTRLEAHHLIHWADGGPTDTHNLACLCPYHHDAHHDRTFNVTGDADNPAGLTFTTRNGFPIHLGPTFSTPPASATPPPFATSPDSTAPSKSAAPSVSATPSQSPAPSGSPRDPGPARQSSQVPVPPPPATPIYRGPTGEH